MKYPLCFLLLIFSIFNSTSQINNSDSRLIGLDDEINEVLKTWNLPGVALAIIENDSIIYKNGFGYKDLKNSVPITTSTLFPIASNSKSFTAALIGILISENRLSLTDNPKNILEGLDFKNSCTASTITIHDILSHQTGLAPNNMSLILFPPENRNEIIRRVKHLPSISNVREDFTYNNLLYSILGIIAEEIESEKWENLVANKIFQPLKMLQSNTSIDELIQNSDYAIGHDLDLNNQETSLFSYKGWEPGGGINSNVEDLGNWLMAWLNNGKFNGIQVIPEQFVKEALSMQTIISSQIPKRTGANFFQAYGYGWMLQYYNGHYRAHHQGGARGYNAMTTLFPNENFGIVILSNEYGSICNSIIRDIVSNRMLNLENQNLNKLYWDAYGNRNSELGDQNSSELNKTIINRKQYLGSYKNDGYGEIGIFEKNEKLYALISKIEFELENINDHNFKLKQINKVGKELLHYLSTHQVPTDFEFHPEIKSSNFSIHFKLEPEIEENIIFMKM